MELTGKSALVLGLGESGEAMARWLAREGAQVIAADSRAQPAGAARLAADLPALMLRLGALPDSLPAGVDLVALSPGLSPNIPAVVAAHAAGVPVVSEIELFASGLARYQPAARVLAITGSNGKTTTTALTAALLRAAGVDAVAAGNISPAALTALMNRVDAGQPPAVWVLELSSFQLEATYALNAAGATVLNVSEDHLDRYAGLDDYAAAKARIFAGSGVQVINRDDARVAAMALPGRAVVRFGLGAATAAEDYGLVDGALMRGDTALLRQDKLQLVGAHNALNALAALALCETVGVAPARVLPALRDFAGLPHRVERVAEAGGVVFIDDSKGTNVGATLAAIEGLGRPVAIILGGDGKGQDFTPLAAAIAAHARLVALIGRDADAIDAALAGCRVPRVRCADMDAAVAACAGAAQPGDAVLLSPACASLDMYCNYAHRAEVFLAAVNAWIHGRAAA